MVASYVSVVFYSCSPAQQLLLVRQLTAEEVHAAHGSGLTWVSPTSKIVPWPRGIVNPQDKLYLVQDCKISQSSVVHRVVDAPEPVAKLLWPATRAPASILEIVDLSRVEPLMPYDNLLEHIPGLPLSLERSCRVQAPSSVLAELHAGTLKGHDESEPQQGAPKKQKVEQSSVFQPSYQPGSAAEQQMLTNKANLTKDLALAKETLSEIVGGLHNAKEQARLWDERQLQLTAEKQRVEASIQTHKELLQECMQAQETWWEKLEAFIAEFSPTTQGSD